MAAEQERPVTEAGRGPGHARRLPSHRVARAIAMAVCAVLAVVATAGAAFYFDLKKSVTVNDALDELREEAKKDPNDPFSGQALNLLVIGTDYRDAENAALAGEDAGMRADTTMLIHVSADRRWIEGFSIPRDLLVTIPACKLSDGTVTGELRNEMFNKAFFIGGGPDENMTSAAACTAKTVRELTGITPNHLMVVKMSGVVKIVNQLGNVTMCLPEAMKEDKKYGNLDLPAGKVELDGLTALQYLRARHGEGFGLDMNSDLTRITRQQAFINALQHQITGSGLLSDPARVYGLAKVVLSATEVDEYLGKIQNWPGLAWGLRNLDSSNIVFHELNLIDAPSDPNRVALAGGAPGAENEAMFQRFIDDSPPQDVDSGATPSGTGTVPATGGTRGPVTPGSQPGTQGTPSIGGGGGESPSAPTPTSTAPVGVCPS